MKPCSLLPHLALAALALQSAAAHADDLRNLLAGNSRVTYQVADEWAVVSEQPGRPVSSVVYQIPNPADADTPESTNIVLMLYDLTTEKGRNGYEAPLPHYSEEEPLESRVAGWTVLKHAGVQNDVTYTILDARNDNLADLAATVRLAWPHLPGNRLGYDEDMERTFRGFLAGIRGEVLSRMTDAEVR